MTRCVRYKTINTCYMTCIIIFTDPMLVTAMFTGYSEALSQNVIDILKWYSNTVSLFIYVLIIFIWFKILCILLEKFTLVFSKKDLSTPFQQNRVCSIRRGTQKRIFTLKNIFMLSNMAFLLKKRRTQILFPYFLKINVPLSE